jgi:hypothetical protein
MLNALNTPLVDVQSCAGAPGEAYDPAFEDSLRRNPRGNGLPSLRRCCLKQLPRPRQRVSPSDRDELAPLGLIKVLIRACPLPNESSVSYNLWPQARYVRLIWLTPAGSCQAREFCEFLETAWRYPYADTLCDELFFEHARGIREFGLEVVDRGLQQFHKLPGISASQSAIETSGSPAPQPFQIVEQPLRPIPPDCGHRVMHARRHRTTPPGGHPCATQDSAHVGRREDRQVRANCRTQLEPQEFLCKQTPGFRERRTRTLTQPTDRALVAGSFLTEFEERVHRRPPPGIESNVRAGLRGWSVRYPTQAASVTDGSGMDPQAKVKVGVQLFRRRHRDDGVHGRLRFLEDPLQQVGATKALCIDLVDVLGAGGSRGKPTAR